MVFVMGGATSYSMERLDYSFNKQQQHDALEVTPLVQQEKRKSPAAMGGDANVLPTYVLKPSLIFNSTL